MKNRKKQLLLLAVVVAVLFLASGCSSPVDPETNEVIQITSETTFSYMLENENWFNAFFVFPLAKLINFLTPYVGVALSVSIVTLLVHCITPVFTIKSTVMTQKMQVIQPEMNRITKKYEGKTDERSQMAQAQEMQRLYKEHGINPFSAILSSFIQLPIIMAIYMSVQRAESVVEGTLWGLSLKQTPLSGILNGEWLYLVIFVFMALCQIGSMMLPQFLANHRAKKEAEQHHRKYVKTKQPGSNMMIYMMIFILVISINWPAAMTIYWAVSSLVTICKTLFVQLVYINKKK